MVLLFELIYHNLNMFLFCCGEDKTQEIYSVKNKNLRNSKAMTFNQIDDKTAESFLSHMQVFKVKKSDYRELVQQY